ncbi:MAG: hypothetical protein NWE78_03310 [Candidatus Bathyarchaeota archaeon]|nr:hypothetical protein [Candidatus Bathyarchaeota archaeon]
MKWKKTSQVKNGYCCPESGEKTARFSRALRINPDLSITSISEVPRLALSDYERKAAEAYKLQVEQRRSLAIANARRVTHL